MFENVGDLTINVNKILVANWLGNRLRVKYRNGLGIEITGETAYELWQLLRRKYTALSEVTIVNTNAIIIVKWLALLTVVRVQRMFSKFVIGLSAGVTAVASLNLERSAECGQCT